MRISILEARRLALHRAGLLQPQSIGLPSRVRGRGRTAIAAAHRVIDLFGYLQLDTVSIAGARSHVIVLLSRLPGFDPALGEALLQPGAPLFEYWGHEASWMPLELYPAFEFRRREFRRHPWWGDVLSRHPELTRTLRRRMRDEGALRSIDMEGAGSRGWWNIKAANRVATALWSSGEWVVRERNNFQRTYDLAERVIPAALRESPLDTRASLELLLRRALRGHGWATSGTLAATWRLRNRREQLAAALRRLVERGRIVSCGLVDADGRESAGWIAPADRDLAASLKTLRPRRDRGVLLSPFDPLLWDRTRVERLFDFDQVLEVFKPAPQRVYGYYCLPVLAGERLVARVDLKADRKRGRLRVLSCRFEATGSPRPSTAIDAEAAHTALARYADALQLELEHTSIHWLTRPRARGASGARAGGGAARPRARAGPVRPASPLRTRAGW